ncbi:MAG: hypothetical protein GY839_18360 [candidate division Zixibacteria bacterium]|nr:hypothetical protein [candidate division Zixibacteria bacterium]
MKILALNFNTGIFNLDYTKKYFFVENLQLLGYIKTMRDENKFSRVNAKSAYLKFHEVNFITGEMT